MPPLGFNVLEAMLHNAKFPYILIYGVQIRSQTKISVVTFTTYKLVSKWDCQSQMIYSSSLLLICLQIFPLHKHELNSLTPVNARS